MILAKAHSVMSTHGYDTVVTGGLEGAHSPQSAHYRNMALDFRSQHIPSGVRQIVYEALCREFGAVPATGKGTTYDVFWERRGEPQEHYHVEVNIKVKE